MTPWDLFPPSLLLGIHSEVSAMIHGLFAFSVAIGVPLFGAGLFITYNRRVKYQWREELMDYDNAVYRQVTDFDLDHIRPVSSASKAPMSRKQTHLSQNVGVHVAQLLSPIECEMLLGQVKEWANSFGVHMHQRQRDWMQADNGAGLDALTNNLVVSDHAEDLKDIKAPWGSGDNMKHDLLPLALRHVVRKVQESFPDLGRLRHIRIDFSPSGQFMRYPRLFPSFDGHDAIILALRESPAPEQHGPPTIVTLSPASRSKRATLLEVMNQSWSDFDIDVMIPSGTIVRIFGQARYNYGLGIRPGAPWFGSSDNIVQDRPRSSGNSSNALTRLWSALRFKQSKKPREAAVIFLHFEGPRAKGKQRFVPLMPESLVFGPLPQPSQFDAWEKYDPSEELLASEGLVNWLVRYFPSRFSE
jgi:hypothetical protein